MRSSPLSAIHCAWEGLVRRPVWGRKKGRPYAGKGAACVKTRKETEVTDTFRN